MTVLGTNRPIDAESPPCVNTDCATQGQRPNTGEEELHSRRGTARKQAGAATTNGDGNGGDTDGIMLRMRIPKWHSFLPGMFR